MSQPTQETLLRLRQRCDRIVKLLDLILTGDDVPWEIVDDFVRLTREEAQQYERERHATWN